MQRERSRELFKSIMYYRAECLKTKEIVKKCHCSTRTILNYEAILRNKKNFKKYFNEMFDNDLIQIIH